MTVNIITHLVPSQAWQNLLSSIGITHHLDLVYMKDLRQVQNRNEPSEFRTVVGFADAYPIHLVHDASLQDLGLGSGISMDRFRGNIIVGRSEDESNSPWVEDSWARIHIQGAGHFRVVSRMVRCAVPNVDQQSGAVGREPYTSMLSTRRIDVGAPKHPCFGMSLVPEPETIGKQISVGALVTVVETGEHKYVPI